MNQIPTGTTIQTPQPEAVHRAVWKAGVMGAINVLVAVIAVRLIVLVAVMGGIGLAYMALQEPDAYRLGVVALFGGFVVLPVVWLSSLR